MEVQLLEDFSPKSGIPIVAFHMGAAAQKVPSPPDLIPTRVSNIRNVMPEAVSRTILAVEMVLLALPGSLFVVPFALPAILLLTPIALLGFVQTVMAGGPEIGERLWTFAGVLLTAMLCISAIAALFSFVGLAGVFLFLGRNGLSGKSTMTRAAILFAAPPLLFSSIPRVWTEVAAGSLDMDSLAATLCYAGVPLLVPAVHLLLEVRSSLRQPPASPGTSGPHV